MNTNYQTYKNEFINQLRNSYNNNIANLNNWLKQNFDNFDKFTSDFTFLYNKKTGKYEYSIYPMNFQGERANFPEDYSVDFNFTVGGKPQLTDFSKNLATTTEIQCKSLQNKEVQEIYVSASGHLLPCCFLGGVFGQFNGTYSRWQFNNKINEIGTDKINLRKNTIEEILNSSYFSNFFLQGWERKSVEEGRLLFCAETCGSISAIDKLYKTKTLDNLVTLSKKSV